MSHASRRQAHRHELLLVHKRHLLRRQLRHVSFNAVPAHLKLLHRCAGLLLHVFTHQLLCSIALRLKLMPRSCVALLARLQHCFDCWQSACGAAWLMQQCMHLCPRLAENCACAAAGVLGACDQALCPLEPPLQVAPVRSDNLLAVHACCLDLDFTLCGAHQA